MKYSYLPKVIILLLITTAVSMPSIGGEIILHNGDIFHGELTAINKQTIIWASETLGDIKIPKEKVQNFSSSTILPTVKTSTHNAENCSLNMSKNIDGVCETGLLSDLQLVELVATKPPPPLPPFGGQIKLDTSRKSGNSDSMDFDFEALLRWNQEEFRHEAEFVAEIDKAEGNVVDEHYQANYQLNYDFNDLWFSYGRFNYDKKRFSAIDEQYLIGIGLGRRIYLKNQLHLNLQLGPSYLITNNPEDDTEKDLASRWAMRLDWPIPGTDITFFHDQELLWLIEGANNNQLETSSGIKIPLFGGMFSEIRYDFDYVGEPTDGQKHADDEWVISVGYTW